MITSTTSGLASKKTEIDLPCIMVSDLTGTIYFVHTLYDERYGYYLGTVVMGSDSMAIGDTNEYINTTEYSLYESDITLRNVL